MLYNPPTGGAANDPYVGKNVAAGIQGSKIPPAVPMFTQQEIVNAITASGQSPTNSDVTQLLQALMVGGLWVGAIGGTSDALTATIPGNVVVAAARAGMMVIGLVQAANTTTSPSLAVAGFAAGGNAPIKKRDGTAPAVGDLAVGLTAFRLDTAGNWRIHSIVQSDLPAPAAPPEQVAYGAAANRGLEVDGSDDFGLDLANLPGNGRSHRATSSSGRQPQRMRVVA